MAKEALNRIDGKKRERIFRTAASEFARHGYHKANINSIARRAGIGKGSVYLYFTNKRDLYYSTLVEAVRLQSDVFDIIEKEEVDPIEKIQKVFEESLKTFPKYRNMYKMYFDLSTSGNETFFAELAQLMEKRSAEFFVKILAEGVALGRIRKDLSIRHAAYVIDSVYTTFLATLACRYQMERMRVFTDSDFSEERSLVKSHMEHILDTLEAGIISDRSRRNVRRKRTVQSGEK